jgi:2-hydroxycyclohexanecarboxyl-CoA dehydrogenase
MQGLKDKVVIVTGGAGGIGSATCRRSRADGAKVAVFDLKLEAARAAAEIAAGGGTALALRCDITDRAEVDAAVAATEAALGPVDVLVNNAGWDVFKPFTRPSRPSGSG